MRKNMVCIDKPKETEQNAESELCHILSMEIGNNVDLISDCIFGINYSVSTEKDEAGDTNYSINRSTPLKKIAEFFGKKGGVIKHPGKDRMAELKIHDNKYLSGYIFHTLYNRDLESDLDLLMKNHNLEKNFFVYTPSGF